MPFVAAMNARGSGAWLYQYRIYHPTGLPDENQHITAHDMALIMEAAMANDTFRTIAPPPPTPSRPQTFPAVTES